MAHKEKEPKHGGAVRGKATIHHGKKGNMPPHESAEGVRMKERPRGQEIREVNRRL